MLTIRYQFSYDTVIELIVMQELGKNAFSHFCIINGFSVLSYFMAAKLPKIAKLRDQMMTQLFWVLTSLPLNPSPVNMRTIQNI